MLATVAVRGGGFDIYAPVAIGLQIGEMAVFIALAILFSVLYGPLPSVMASIIFLYIGHNLPLLLKYGEQSGWEAMRWLTLAVYYIFPNLEKFNIRDLVVYQQGIPAASFCLALLLYIQDCTARFCFFWPIRLSGERKYENCKKVFEHRHSHRSSGRNIFYPEGFRPAGARY
jgi:hypothetical protein